MRQNPILPAIAACALLVLSSQGWASDSNDGLQQGQINVGGLARTYWIHLPPDSKTDPMPLVIVLHGGGGKGSGAAQMSNMNAKADENGFIAVYPDGTGRFEDKLLTWNTWNCCGFALSHNADDTGFIRALIGALEKKYPIDPKRIYATGLSNGGMMSHRLGCELSDQIAAIAPVAGALNTLDPRPTDPVSVIIFHGTEDRHVPYEGGHPRARVDLTDRVDQPVSYAVDFWVRHNQCSPKPETETFGHIVKETYRGGKNGTEVVLYKIIGGGHSWPGGKPGLRNSNVDAPTQEISATDLIWEFFAAHPKR